MSSGWYPEAQQGLLQTSKMESFGKYQTNKRQYLLLQNSPSTGALVTPLVSFPLEKNYYRLNWFDLLQLSILIFFQKSILIFIVTKKRKKKKDEKILNLILILMRTFLINIKEVVVRNNLLANMHNTVSYSQYPV